MSQLIELGISVANARENFVGLGIFMLSNIHKVTFTEFFDYGSLPYLLPIFLVGSSFSFSCLLIKIYHFHMFKCLLLVAQKG